MEKSLPGNRPTCDIVHRVKWGCVAHVHSKQHQKNNGKTNQQIDRHCKCPISTKTEYQL